MSTKKKLVLFIMIMIAFSGCDNKDKVYDEFYTVSFDLNYEDAQLISDSTVKRGDYITMPQNPERDNFIFAGW